MALNFATIAEQNSVARTKLSKRQNIARKRVRPRMRNYRFTCVINEIREPNKEVVIVRKSRIQLPYNNNKKCRESVAVSERQ